MADALSPAVEVMEIDRSNKGARTILDLAGLFRRWAPDIIHCRNWNAWPDTVAAHRITLTTGRARPSLAWSFHGFPDTAAMPWRRRIASQGLARLTDRMFAVCRDSANRYADQAGIPQDRFEVLYNGVDCSRFAPSEDKTATRRRLNLPEDRPLALTIASLTPIKNHETLVDAVAGIRDRLPNHAHFLCLGEGALRQSLEARIHERGLTDYISLPGATDKVTDYLQAADLFILPSRLEGMSNAILEAMACGLPVVAFPTGGNPELVIHGQTGMLPEAQTPEGLGEAIGVLLEDEALRTSMGLAARERAVSEFSIDAMIHRYADFYRQMVENSPARKNPN
jgi:glycosyltransferase involved in cell wall biosynthesis